MSVLSIVEFKPGRYFIVNERGSVWSEFLGGFGYWWTRGYSQHGTVFRNRDKARKQADLLENAGFVA